MKKLLAVLVFLLLPLSVFASSYDEVRASNLQYIETKRGAGYVFLSFKMDVENSGEKGSVYIKLLGKSEDGFEIQSAHADGIVDGNTTAVLTTTTAISEKENNLIANWEIGSIRKHLKQNN